MNNLLFFLLLCFSLFTCQQAGESMATRESAVEEYDAAYAEDEAQAGEAQFTSGQEAPTPTILLRTADCQLEVDDLDGVLEQLTQLASFYDGYLSDVNRQNFPYQRRIRTTVRIPAKHFDTLLDSLEAWAKVLDNQTITTTDVTEEYVDIQSRLDTKRAVRDRYLAILRNQARTVEEILLAEEKIRVLQEEIEAKEGRLRYLRNRADFSTIQVEMYQQVEAIRGDRPSWGKRFLSESWEALRGGGDILRFLYLAVLNLWPILLLLGLLWWQRKRILRPWRKR